MPKPYFCCARLSLRIKILLIVLICLIHFQTIYQFYNSLKLESTIELLSASESDSEPCENEQDETESTEFLIHNTRLTLSTCILGIFYNNLFSFVVPSLNRKVPIPPPEG